MSSSDSFDITSTPTCIRRKKTPVPDSELSVDDGGPDLVHSLNSGLPKSTSPQTSHSHEDKPPPLTHVSHDSIPESSDPPESNDNFSKVSTDDEPLCRICLAGRDDEDVSLGRFIQPCLCRGTMAYIHVGCLRRWRLTAPSLRSFYQCDQCGYRYKLRRAKVAGLAENKMILGCVTMAVFSLLVTLGGFAAGWLLEGHAVRNMAAEDGWTYGFGSLSYDSTGKFVGEAVSEAVRVLNSKLPLDINNPTRLKVKTNSDTDKNSRLESVSDGADESYTYRYVNAKRRSGSTQRDEDGGSGTAGYITRNQKPLRAPHCFQDRLKPWVELIVMKMEKFIKHSILGLAFIGILSFFQLVMSLTFISPFNFGLRHSVLRMIRTNHGRPGARDASGLGSAMIVTFMLLGLATAIRSVWCFVRRCSQWMLRKVEDSVLDVRS
ncbi:hypothetical protein CROQUDRAFT_664042 [Cronartium quercuum f. sp. fusiforme G11]|uniref:RING-CH-type domain-containing protein n=1 Tax=Cronartium quercuum f. sp. fusiforme G11 TaxID=708437 RepID=A0A9P6T777_9BASI|nr:hypothetical protein CROQUDRAFT_664042 [Cronartium quercuum f. sp. fusiforme G11]